MKSESGFSFAMASQPLKISLLLGKLDISIGQCIDTRSILIVCDVDL